jgi:type I restriction enzyme S subunit
MIEGIEPYPSYAPARVPWAPELPIHWRVERGKALFRKVVRPVRPDDEVVTCFRDGTVTLRRNRRTSGFTEAIKELGYQGIRRGDLVIHAMDAFAGAVGVADSDGKGTPVYGVCVPRHAANTRYYAHIVREMARQQWVLALARGIRERSTDFRFDAFAVQDLPVPPPEEQAAIVRFLDHADRRIRRYIRAKQKLIKLLEEQKQAIIHEAVTRGLDPSVPTRATGSNWFPQVPAHWQVVTMGRVVPRAVDGPHHSPKYVDEGIPFLSARNVKIDRWSLDDAKYISASDYQEFSRRVVPEVGDVLYTKGGTTGVARAVDLDFPFQVWVHIAVLKLRKDMVDPFFLANALNSPRCYQQSQLFTRGATNQDLGLSRMRQIEITLPPIHEQRQITDALRGATANIVNAVDAARREIALLRELRTRLIADVVTGQLDVRAAAAALPDEPTDDEPLDDVDEPGEADDIDADAASESDDA